MADGEENAHDEDNYLSVVQAVKLIPFTFDGNPKQLREFIEGVEAAIEVVHPSKQPLLLKFIESKITGDAKDRLLARTERLTWVQVKAILEENYLVKRTLEYYAGILFNSKQSVNETVAQWGSRLDSMAVELRREVRTRLERLEHRDQTHYVEGGLQLIGEFLKGTFVAGLKDERVKYIVKAKGEDDSLAQLVETAIQEECEVKSLKFKNNQGAQWYQQGAIKKEYKQGPQIKREINVTSKPQCFRCQGIGHIARNCQNAPQCKKCNKRGHETHQCRQQGNRQ